MPNTIRHQIDSAVVATDLRRVSPSTLRYRARIVAVVERGRGNTDFVPYQP
jgi:hypothetical protein